MIFSKSTQKKKRIIIVGGGFAGINLAKKIDPNLYRIMLIDQLNYHQFQPLLYQVATSQIEASDVSFPLRYIFRKSKLRIRLAKVSSVNTEEKYISTGIGNIRYDYLVLAIGCTTNFFGNERIKQHCLNLKTTLDAVAVRNHILELFEKIITADKAERDSLQNIVVVGAGPTGVELAGAIAEIKKNILPKDYHRVDFSLLRIILIEGSGHTLNNLSSNAKAKSEMYLKKLGVEVVTNTIVKDYDGALLITNNPNYSEIKTKTVIWTAGIIGNTIGGLPEGSKAPAGRITVTRTNQIIGLDNVFAVGDVALMVTEKYPKGHPQLANVAISQAKNLAQNLNNLSKGKPLTNYEYKDNGSMATIGKNKAVVDLPFLKFSGVMAWFVWMSLHLMLILGVRNKMVVFINWAWAYFTKNTALRIILKSDGDKPTQEETVAK